MTSRCVATKESINSSDAAGDSLSIEKACHFFFSGHDAGIREKAIKLRPIAVIKG